MQLDNSYAPQHVHPPHEFVLPLVHQLRASSDPQAYALAFVGMLKVHQFERAASEFYYPQSYTSQELAADQTTMAKSLAALIGQIGELRGELEPLSGLKLAVSFGIHGGDRSHPTPELDANRMPDRRRELRWGHFVFHSDRRLSGLAPTEL